MKLSLPSKEADACFGPRAPRRMILVAALAVFLPACQTQQQRDANSPAYKAGEATRRAATEAEKASAEAARKLEESAREAREGWKEQERKDRDRTDH